MVHDSSHFLPDLLTRKTQIDKTVQILLALRVHIHSGEDTPCFLSARSGLGLVGWTCGVRKGLTQAVLLCEL